MPDSQFSLFVRPSPWWKKGVALLVAALVVVAGVLGHAALTSRTKGSKAYAVATVPIRSVQHSFSPGRAGHSTLVVLQNGKSYRVTGQIPVLPGTPAQVLTFSSGAVQLCVQVLRGQSVCEIPWSS